MESENVKIRHVRSDEWQSVWQLTNTVSKNMPEDVFLSMFTKDDNDISLIAVDANGA